MTYNPEQHCLVVKCENGSGTRGLCQSCYTTARQMISLGQTSEEELIKKGLILPKKRNSRTLFREQFENK